MPRSRIMCDIDIACGALEKRAAGTDTMTISYKHVEEWRGLGSHT